MTSPNMQEKTRGPWQHLGVKIDPQTISVIVSGVVAVAGVSIPAWTKRGDRKHDRSLREADRQHEKEMLVEKHEDSWRQQWWAERQSAYLDMTRATGRMLVALDASADLHKRTGEFPPLNLPTDDSPIRDLTTRVQVYGSEGVRRLARDVNTHFYSIINGDSSELFDRMDEALPKLRATYGLLAHLVGEELRGGPANAPQ